MSAETEQPLQALLLQRCTFPAAGSAVTCAVSGGADSMALLVLAVAAGCQVTAVHVDHGLRPGSSDEAAVVRQAATRFGAQFRAERINLVDGPNLEARARAARYAVLPAGVLTGHTADDQAETVLINLLRGAAAGLAGIADDGRRPLLRLRRAETEALCAELGMTTVDDPSNRDPRFLRNRVRHALLPDLSVFAGRDLTPILARQARLIAEDNELLDSLAEALDPTDAGQLCAAPRPLARRAVRRWLTNEHPPDVATVERVLAVAEGQATGCDVGGGRSVRRRQGRLRLVGPGVCTTEG